MMTGKIKVVIYDNPDNATGKRNSMIIDASKSLTMYAIYKNPDDYPGKYVMRKCYAGGDVPSGKIGMDIGCEVSDSYDGIVRFIPDGCVRIGRSPNDVPSVLETWM